MTTGLARKVMRGEDPVGWGTRYLEGGPRFGAVWYRTVAIDYAVLGASLVVVKRDAQIDRLPSRNLAARR